MSDASQEHAKVPGFGDIRVWGDASSAELEAWMDARLQRERAALGLSAADHLPDAAYLAISGGGENGAYGAGLLCGWSDRGDRPSFRIITGVSAGALIAPFVFVGAEGDSVLREVFTSTVTTDVARSRGLLDGLFGDGLYDSEPLRILLRRHIDDAFLDRVAAEFRSGRDLFVATTNLDTLRPVIWDMGLIAASGNAGDVDLFIDILVASASIPAVFPPVLINVECDGQAYDEMHVDGGATTQVFLYPPSFNFRRFSESHHARRDRTVYVIRNSGIKAGFSAVPRKTLDIAQRSVASLIETQGIGDLYRIYLECQRDGIAFRLATIPAGDIQRTSELFDRKYMAALFAHGYASAAAGYPWVQAPPGFGEDEDMEPDAAPSGDR
jgi:predicted acylesterase/phospholipase RssA